MGGETGPIPDARMLRVWPHRRTNRQALRAMTPTVVISFCVSVGGLTGQGANWGACGPATLQCKQSFVLRRLPGIVGT